MSFGTVLLSMCALHYADTDFRDIQLVLGHFARQTIAWIQDRPSASEEGGSDGAPSGMVN